MGIDATAVARGTGVTTNFKDLSGGSTKFVPQRIALIAPGEDALSYSSDKFLVDNGADQVGQIYGYGSPLYAMANELLPKNGVGIGTVILEVIALANVAGALATGAVDVVAGTATGSASYYPTLGGLRGQAVTVKAGTIVPDVVRSDIADSINNTLGMPAKATLTYGVPVSLDSTNILLTVLSVTGNPKGGAYAVTCSDATGQLFNVYDAKGALRAKDAPVGVTNVDGLQFTIGSTVATLGETANVIVAVTSVDLEILWAGTTGNEVSLEMDGPATLGVIWTITPFVNGAGETSVDDALAQIGEAWTTILLTTEKTEAQLNRYVVWGEARWGELVHKPAVAFYGDNQKTVGEATFLTQDRTSDRVTCQLVDPGSNDAPWRIAAAQVNAIARMAQKNPAHDYGSQPIFNLNTGEDIDQWDYNQRDLAVKGGTSTIEVKGGIVNISDVVTPWSPLGESPPAYRYICDIVKLQQVINNIDLTFNNSEWDGAPLIPFGPTTNASAKTPKMAIAAVALVIDNLALEAIISDAATAKKTIKANINPSNPKRLDVSVTVQVAGNANIRDATLNWGFFFGSAPVVG